MRINENVIMDPKNRIRGARLVEALNKARYALNNDMAFLFCRPKNTSFIAKYANGSYDKALMCLKSAFNEPKAVVVNCIVDDENHGNYTTPDGVDHKFKLVNNDLYVAYISYKSRSSLSGNGEYVKFGFDEDDFVYFISYHTSDNRGQFVDWRGASSEEGEGDPMEFALKLAEGWNRQIQRVYPCFAAGTFEVTAVSDSRLRFTQPRGAFTDFWEPFRSTFPNTMFFPYFFEKLEIPVKSPTGIKQIGDTKCVFRTAILPVLNKYDR